MAIVMESDPAPAGGAAPGRPVLQASAALVGDGEDIARARHIAAGFLTRVQAEHGLPVSQRALELTQLVVSELVTNARKYAPGPVLLDLQVTGGVVEVAVWDSDPVLPIARATDADRVGQHGLEIVMAVSQGFAAQREPVGKRVTSRLALADDPGDALHGRQPL
ncbi:Histidine kinase-, DNA gyrase B-, and HSP90-like ATPase [Streptomyces cyanogenus]|uniref:Histidine kinase-, DNA gyrase B-, and HSP90-like ATPase n=2 Tax=Streptomyces cyanogenus TaxID=80860 RepID=A0ABX7THH3_STRCY|nr:Histidine kinase-, DNA gyrase B-, and HSP90-like ATPase [Streptomyces cyanogenus]